MKLEGKAAIRLLDRVLQLMNHFLIIGRDIATILYSYISEGSESTTLQHNKNK